MQAINPINTHTKFGKDRINTFPLNERKPSVRMPDGRKSKNNIISLKTMGKFSLNPIIQKNGLAPYSQIHYRPHFELNIHKSHHHKLLVL